MDATTATGNNATSIVTRIKAADPMWMNCNSGIRWKIEGAWVSGLGDHFEFLYDNDGSGFQKFAAIDTDDELYIGGSVNEGYTF